MDDWNYITDEQRNASRILAPEIAAAMKRSNYQNTYDDIDAFIKLPINKDKIRKYKLDDGYVKKYLIPQIKTAYDNLKGTSMPYRYNTNPMHPQSSPDYNYGGTRRKRRSKKAKKTRRHRKKRR
jgi:hypothetical protein